MACSRTHRHRHRVREHQELVRRRPIQEDPLQSQTAPLAEYFLPFPTALHYCLPSAPPSELCLPFWTVPPSEHSLPFLTVLPLECCLPFRWAKPSLTYSTPR